MHSSVCRSTIRWFRNWEERVLVEDWIPIRFQPILFTFLFVGAIFVLTRSPVVPLMTEVTGTFSAYAWLLGALVCPPILFGAWLMIHFGTGRKVYFGYWMRFAADMGQAFSFAAFLALMVGAPYEPRFIYSQIVLGAIMSFLVIVVIRDILKLVLLERTSTTVRRIWHVRDVKNAEDVKDILQGRSHDDESG